jgi:endonuclease YncB( thermonuclease family)
MAWNFETKPELPNSQMAAEYFNSPHKQITEDFVAEVIRVHDGDTITVRTNFRDFDFPIRFAGIDTKELAEGGDEARKWTENLIGGETIDVLIDANNRVGKYGRLIGTIVFHGMNINELMVLQGMAVTFENRDELQSRAFNKAAIPSF